MSDVVLVQPRASLFDEVLEGHSLPLSIMIAGSVVAQERKITLIDQRTSDDWEGELRSAVRSGPVCVGTTTMTGIQIWQALEISRTVKDEDPEIPVVWGGPHATLDPAGTVRHPLVDAAVVGDGEHTLWELVRALEDGRPLSAIKGLVYSKDGKVHVNPPRPPSALDELPDPPFHLLRDPENYIFGRRGRRCMSVPTSRGCPRMCTFCVSTVVGRGMWRAMSVVRVLDLVTSMVERFDLGFVWFEEQDSFIDRKRILAIAQGFVDRGLDIQWEANAHVTELSRMSDEDLSILERGGMKDLIIGVESGSQRILDSINKGLSIETVHALNRRLASYPFHPRYCVMSGFPGETEEDLAATVSLMARVIEENPRASTNCLYPVIPYPGTEYLAKAMAQGLEPPDSLEGWTAFDTYVALRDGLDRILPWVTEERAKLLRRLYVISNFIDEKSDIVSNPVLRTLSRLYRPVARARFFSMNTSFMELEDALYIKGREGVFTSPAREPVVGPTMAPEDPR
ncbi:MAG: radical SAM protein [Candidatus Undinarchaeales archaeon]|nr:radical SAM protein [Candidatus Undinarchaeales archaeon]MDP7491529.1 radical SAM protein [Candidatus Undinarchaeales archaeon]